MCCIIQWARRQWIRWDVDLRDCVGALGLLLLSIGTAAIYWPAALIVAGGILLYLALSGVKRHVNPD